MAQVPQLPAQLPTTAQALWEFPLQSSGLGGVSATADLVILSDRELKDTVDAWHCLDAHTGKKRWSYRIPAPGNLDYGNSPRSNAVLSAEHAFVFGAFGDLACLDLATGKEVWSTNLQVEYEPAELPKWGTCSTPLLWNDSLIVNPGAKEASLVALEAKTGKLRWKTPGFAAGYGNLILCTINSKPQIIGHDAKSLRGWDPETGQVLWQVIPPNPNDFNVPTPIPIGNHLFVTTENNGSRLYRFDAAGKLNAEPVAKNRRLAPDTHSPVLCGNRIVGFGKRMHCLQAETLEEIWEGTDAGFTKYCSLVSDGKVVLATTMNGECLRIDPSGTEMKITHRLRVLESEKGMYAHPAFCQGVAYLRGTNSLVAVKLSG